MSRRYISVALPLVAFVLLAIEAHRRAQVPGDVRIARWIQSWSIPGFDRICSASNWFFQTGPVITCTLLVMLWCLFRRDKRSAFVVAGTIVLRLISPAAKAIVKSDRPTVDLVHVGGSSTGYGFPSGHTSAAVLLVGSVAWLITCRQSDRRIRFAVWLVAVLIVVQTGLGRIRVGAHWPSDVLGALLWSIPVLIVRIYVAMRKSGMNQEASS